MSTDNAAVAGWHLSMGRSSSLQQQMRDQPRFWTKTPEILETFATARLVKLGSGADIYASILPAIEEAEVEVILVTCFWAKSESSELISTALRRLSRRGEEQGFPIHVRICCSSISLWQKMLHTRSLKGRSYGQETWQKVFHLPPAHELPGIDLEIKSIFVLPFSVMHPKFIMIDRTRVFLPSCNVSWENWFEGCIELTGPVVHKFIRFWQEFWTGGQDRDIPLPGTLNSNGPIATALFLPSPHHALSLFDGFGLPTSPPTPLNLFLLSIFSKARREVYLQTPNLTSRVVLNALVKIMARGVAIRIVTSERLMIMEQIVTARTTTARCVKWLIRQHQAQISHAKSRSEDVELLATKPGSLSISYYERHLPSDPVQSHIKVSMADDNIIVLGSGNLDRASWVTSQELGVAIIDKTFVEDFRVQLDLALQGRLKQVYP